MRGVLRKWTPRDTFQISKPPDTLSFFIIPRIFPRNLTEVAQIYMPDKFTQSGCIPSKIKYEILAYKGSQTTRPHQEIISPPKNADNMTSLRH